MAAAAVSVGPFICISPEVVDCAQKFVASKVLKPLVDKVKSLYPHITIIVSKKHAVAFWDGDRNTILLNPDADATQMLLALLFEVLNAIHYSAYVTIREDVKSKKTSKDLFVWFMERKEHGVSLESVRVCEEMIAAKELPAKTKKKVFYTDAVKHYAVQWLYGHSEHWCKIYDSLTTTKQVAKGPWPKPICDFQRVRLINLLRCDTEKVDTKEIIDRWKSKYSENPAYVTLVENAEWFLSPNRTNIFSQRLVEASGG